MKNTLKKGLLLIAVLAALAFALAGCTDKGYNNNETQSGSISTEEENNTETGADGADSDSDEQQFEHQVDEEGGEDEQVFTFD